MNLLIDEKSVPDFAFGIRDLGFGQSIGDNKCHSYVFRERMEDINKFIAKHVDLFIEETEDEMTRGIIHDDEMWMIRESGGRRFDALIRENPTFVTGLVCRFLRMEVLSDIGVAKRYVVRAGPMFVINTVERVSIEDGDWVFTGTGYFAVGRKPAKGFGEESN